jgi:hypothetical protein
MSLGGEDRLEVPPVAKKGPLSLEARLNVPSYDDMAREGIEPPAPHARIEFYKEGIKSHLLCRRPAPDFDQGADAHEGMLIPISRPH